MSAATATSVPAAGWYPDPRGDDASLRWWDGAAWTTYTTDPPDEAPQPRAPHPFADIVVDIAADEEVPVDDEGLDDLEPIEFSWCDPSDLFEANVSEPEDGPFVFRARPLEPRSEVAPEPGLEVPARPVYESPLAAISSPVSVRVEIPVRVEAAPPRAAAPEAPPAPPAAAPRRRTALAGTGAVVALAATAAMISNVLGGHDSPGRQQAAPAGAVLSGAERGCLKEWNTTASGGAAQLRVTLGQFQGALARVGPVDPLSGTTMAPDSCALTLYDPASDSRAVFVSGVKDQVGYLDVTTYPRALKQYAAPRTARQANVTIRPDGSLRAR